MESEICDGSYRHSKSSTLMPISTTSYQSATTYFFKKLHWLADTLQAKLLLENPTDLFQIGVSYFRNAEEAKDITLILHIPMAQKWTVLSPIQFLLPRPHHNLFAIYSNKPWLSINMTEADWEGCWKVSFVDKSEYWKSFMRDLAWDLYFLNSFSMQCHNINGCGPYFGTSSTAHW